MREEENGLLKFITCGSVDDGKSTLIGHMLYDSKLLYADQKQALMLDSQVGSRGGEIDYSLLLDGLMSEREQGITIDVAYRYFTTERRSFIVADTPGHEEYTRNMAVGASFADLAVILVDASQGVLVQTRRHARICALMGIRSFVFAVNKMDLVGYSQTCFSGIADDIEKLEEEVGIKGAVVIPVSATEGDNVTRHSDKMTWYSGPALLEYLETVDISAGAPEAGFYMPVQRVCRPDLSFRGFQGQVEAGKVSAGDTVTALPSGETARVQSVYVADREEGSAVAGQPVTVRLEREVDISRGCVLASGADLKVAESFSATLLWMDDQMLVPGKDYWLKLGTKMQPAVVTEIRRKVDVNSGALLPADSAAKNEIVQCGIMLSEIAVVDEFRLHKTLGELILIDRVTHSTAACGVVEAVDERCRDGVFLTDGTVRAEVHLFDAFYYHPDVHAVLRHGAPPANYRKGDRLPLQSAAFHYPRNFDMPSASGYYNIRGDAFAGCGPRDSRYPLIDAYGMDGEGSSAGGFGKYRSVPIWGSSHEI